MRTLGYVRRAALLVALGGCAAEGVVAAAEDGREGSNEIAAVEVVVAPDIAQPTEEVAANDIEPADTDLGATDAISESFDEVPDDGDRSEDTGATEAPLIVYTLTQPRRLFFLNNPEQLHTTELGDSTLMDATLLRVDVAGPARSFFEHKNETGRTIGFGLQVYNAGDAPVAVTVSGVGFTVGLEGGGPFADAFGGRAASGPTSLGAGRSMWILRADDAVPPGQFFSGVVDFQVEGGSAIVNHIAYDDFAGLDGATAERDYVVRVEPDGTREARMYKGVASASEAGLTLSARIPSGAPAGPIAVDVRPWSLSLAAFGERRPAFEWISHIGPGQNALATTSDMVTLTFRDWIFDPLASSDATGSYPNLGNWGVVYRLHATLHNDDDRSRRVTWRVDAAPGAGAALAYLGSDGVWRAERLAAGQRLDLATVTVPPAGSASLAGAFVLGGPSGGALRQSLELE